MCLGSVTTTAQLVVAEVFEVVVGAAGLLAGHAADAVVDGLAFEAMAGCLDFCDDIAAGELGGAGALAESFDGIEDGVAAAGGGSAILACSGGTVMAGPLMAVWRFVLCKPRSTNSFPTVSMASGRWRAACDLLSELHVRVSASSVSIIASSKAARAWMRMVSARGGDDGVSGTWVGSRSTVEPTTARR